MIGRFVRALPVSQEIVHGATVKQPQIPVRSTLSGIRAAAWLPPMDVPSGQEPLDAEHRASVVSTSPPLQKPLEKLAMQVPDTGDRQSPSKMYANNGKLRKIDPIHPGLVEMQPFDPMFAEPVSYRRYRLKDSNSSTGIHFSGHAGRYIGAMNPALASRKFDGTDPVSILSFLKSFCKACDEYQVTEGLALLSALYYLEGDAKDLY